MLRINILFALSYFLGGYLGALISIPPSHASPIWPAAGIALAGMVIYGPKVIPGIWLGALVTQVFAFLDASSPEAIILSLVIGVVASTAATAQAALGSWLINRYVGLHNPLTNDRSILRFMALGGPVSCVISASAGIIILYFKGVTSLQDIPSGWVTWWIGDTIGVLIFTPIVLCFTGMFRVSWRMRINSVALPLVILSLLVLVMLHFGKQHEQTRIKILFEEQSRLLHNAVQNELTRHVEINENIKNLFDSSAEVTDKDFKNFTETLLSDHPDIRSLEWIPLVTADNRSVFEQRSGFKLTVPDADSKQGVRPAPSRREYFPIAYIKSYLGNARAPGLDIAFQPASYQAIQKARNTAQTTLSVMFRLAQDPDSRPSVVIYSPVYHSNKPSSILKQRRQQLRGFVATVVRLNSLVNGVKDQFEQLQLLLKITDAGDELINETVHAPSLIQDFPILEKTLLAHIADRSWEVTYTAAPQFYNEQLSWNIWWLILGGFLLTGLTSVGLLMLTGRTLQTEDMVTLRTEALEKEIAKHKQAELALQESEKRLMLSIKGSNDAPWDWNLETNQIVYSPQWWHMLGYEVDELTGDADLWQSLVHPEDRDFIQQDLRKAMESRQESHAVELRLRHKNGHYIPILTRCFITRNEAGTVLRMSGTNMDLTERRRAQHLEEMRGFMLECLTSGMSLVEMLELIAVRLEGLMTPGALCSILLLDDDRRHLRLGAAPNLPDFYNQAIDGLQFGEEPGYFVNAAFTGKCTMTLDIARDPNWSALKTLAEKAGLVSCWTEPILTNNNKILGAFAIYQKVPDLPADHDIKLIETAAYYVSIAIERKRVETQLRLANKAFEQSCQGFMITDARHNILKVNHAFTIITGYNEADALGQSAKMLSSGRHNLDFFRSIWASIDTENYWQGEVWNRRQNGEIYPELLSISAVHDDSGHISQYVSVFADITELKASEAHLEFIAHHDTLTALPNRLRLFFRLEHGIDAAKREGAQLALLMLDLDRFKDVNDSFGHLAGDQLLQLVAKRLMLRLRKIDTVSRLGGDEFTVLLENISQPEDAARIAQEIISDLNEPWVIPNCGEVLIGVSIGISLYPQHGDTPELLLQQADAALYKAKESGRNCFSYFSNEFTVAARERIELEAGLRRALLQNELRIHYQPQIDIATGRIVGAEALVRWQDPLEGLIPPGRFIPVAEQTGLILALGAWVLNETCRQGRQWLEEGLKPLTLAVNVSPHQLRQGDISALIAEILRETRFPADCLELELTESALMDRQTKAIELLGNLRAQGVRLAIDDFGTGYSSLAYLKRFPLNSLKIDKSFIDDIPHQQDDMEIAASIIAMGHILGFKVLAEGVETQAQLDFLKAKGCDLYQGYLNSPPLPAEDFAALLQKID